MALSKVEHLVILSFPTASLLLWICCHETAYLEDVSIFHTHTTLIQHEIMLRQCQMIWDCTNKCFDQTIQHATRQRWKYHHLPSNTCRQATSGTDRFLLMPFGSLSSHPGPKYSVNKRLKTAGGSFSPTRYSHKLYWKEHWSCFVRIRGQNEP